MHCWQQCVLEKINMLRDKEKFMSLFNFVFMATLNLFPLQTSTNVRLTLMTVTKTHYVQTLLAASSAHVTMASQELVPTAAVSQLISHPNMIHICGFLLHLIVYWAMDVLHICSLVAVRTGMTKQDVHKVSHCSKREVDL